MTQQHASVETFMPSLPKGGGAIQSIGTGWGAIGATGGASFSVPLPISSGRGFAPTLSLNYSSALGNGPFGLGWTASPGSIRRNTDRGAPDYDADKAYVGPGGGELSPEKTEAGTVKTTSTTQFNTLQLNTSFTVTRYFPRVETTFSRVEHWSSSADPGGFWLVQSADGTLHFYGKTRSARCFDHSAVQHVAEWLLEESLSPLGEQIYYDYKREVPSAEAELPRDFRSQCYLKRICYGNLQATSDLQLWSSDVLADKQWHFEMWFDYGERSTSLSQVPGYTEQQTWQLRPDPFFSYVYGFELGSRRLCKQILTFHYFPLETALGPEPVLVKRMLLEYKTSGLGASFLSAFHSQAFDAAGVTKYWPPLELTYSSFELTADPARYLPFQALQGPGDGQRYQMVDLYSDGLPGVLYGHDRLWQYREPVRDTHGTHTDAVVYGPLQTLPTMPVSGSRESLRQQLADLNGDGQLDWILAQPDMSGFFSLNSRRRWSDFATFAALPVEFFHPQGQLADLMGNGIHDLALIGTRSVRLYINQGDQGFTPGREVPHPVDDDALPVIGHSPSELVAFSDILGSGQQHLIRIRHNEVKCWPNLGRGRFGKGFVFARLPFSYAQFDASRVVMADLDGSGAVDLIYLEPEHALIFMNLFGNGLEASPLHLPWPQGARYDSSCRVSTADLQGLGCSSLIVSIPHATPAHWRYDFVSSKPYLLTASDNNMGASGTLTYRSSAQEWLDEKQERSQAKKPSICGVPFPLHLVTQQQQHDAISGNRLTRRFQYREGYYNGHERKFQGFGLLLETDTDTQLSATLTTTAQHTEPLMSKTWFHTGKATDLLRSDYFSLDANAHPLGYTAFSRLSGDQSHDTLIKASGIADVVQEINHALAGLVLRQEVYAAKDPRSTAVPYSVSQQRYLIRQVNNHASMLALNLETISYRYEREAADPACQHTINLRWDAYGDLTHSVTVHYARRKTPLDASPFTDTYQAQWWQDTHDSAQQSYYLTETRSQSIHLDNPQRWRLHLPYRQRTNALVLAKGNTPQALTPQRISYEHFIDEHADAPLGVQAQRTLVSLSTQYYRGVQASKALPSGQASFQALADHTETAELDDHSLKAYEDIPQLPGAEPFDLESALTQAHYHRMSLFLPEPATATPIWSIKKNFTRYNAAQGFYRAYGVRPTQSHGVTHFQHDRYYCQIASVKTADGCMTKVQYDYRLLLPVNITDPQGTQQQARYDAFGQLRATSFFGQERGQPAGFKPLSDYRPPEDDSPDNAIKNPESALLNAATASFYNPFSWMGYVPPSAQRLHWITQGYLLPNGYVREHARNLTLDMGNPSDKQFYDQLQKTQREPVHSVVLQADRYPANADEPAPLIRINLSCSDGFGRLLQTKQLAPGGIAYKVNTDGALEVDSAGKPALEQSERRWRVSSRVEYNNKGLAIRNYRPYFADQHRYIKDESLRKSGYSDQVFYDALGRPTHTLNARGDLSRQTYCTWYTISEDENDTYGLEQNLPSD